MRTEWITALALALVVASAGASAQRGMGESAGVAQGAAPDRSALRGEISEVIVETCAQTTGRYREGVHVVVAMPDGQTANVHLGPASEVQDVLDAAAVGDEVTAEVFQTDAMPFGAFVAVTVTIDGETFRLRGDDLRPRWAVGPGGGQGRAAGGGQGQGGQGRTGGGCWWNAPLRN